MKELTVVVMLMAQIQLANNTETMPSYDAKAVSEVNASSKVHEQISHVKRKTFIQTSDDDQIDSNIIFNDPYVENNGGTSDHDSNAHDEYHEIQMLAYNLSNLSPQALYDITTMSPSKAQSTLHLPWPPKCILYLLVPSLYAAATPPPHTSS
ncbi:hypothetical protein Tco_1340645 [Tanacetum coccineum]